MSEHEERNLLVIGTPEHDADAYHLSGFLAPDAVICLRVAGKRYLAVSSLEYGRAAKEAPVDELLSYEELEITRLSRELKSGAKAYAVAIANLLEKLGASGSPIAVPPGFGVIYADELRARGVTLNPDRVVFEALRRAKTGERSPTSRGPRPPSRPPAPTPSRSSRNPRSAATAPCTGAAGR
jgi:Xaa-Pro aminopeptidase